MCSNALEFSVGSFYDPHLLSDFEGPIFRLLNAKLMQREVIDCDDKLVPPWEMDDKLRPGTLDLMKVQLLTRSRTIYRTDRTMEPARYFASRQLIMS